MATSSWQPYQQDEHYDELLTKKGRSRPAAKRAVQFLRNTSPEAVLQRRAAADLTIKEMGVSFTVYSDGENIDRA